MVLQEVGGYLGSTGRGANPFGKAARDPDRTFSLAAAQDSTMSEANLSPVGTFIKPSLRYLRRLSSATLNLPPAARLLQYHQALFASQPVNTLVLMQPV